MSAIVDEIAYFIESRNLYPIRKGNIPLATQIMLRSTKSKGAYHHLFEQISPDHICLRDSYIDFPIRIAEALDAIIGYNNELFHPPTVTLRVKDIGLGRSREIKISPENVVCIITRFDGNKKTGRKKFIYLKEKGLNGEDEIGEYSIHRGLEELYHLIDPLNNHLAIVSDSTLVNVAYYQLSKYKILKTILKDKAIITLPRIMFSESEIAKLYREKFELIQKHHLNRTSLLKNILGYKNDIGL